MHVVTLRPELDGVVAERLLAIQHAAYRVEASLIGDDRIPPLHEGVEDLVVSGLHWLSCMDDGG